MLAPQYQGEVDRTAAYPEHSINQCAECNIADQCVVTHTYEVQDTEETSTGSAME